MLLIGVLDVHCTAATSCRAEELVHRFAKQRLTFAAWKVKVKVSRFAVILPEIVGFSKTCETDD